MVVFLAGCGTSGANDDSDSPKKDNQQEDSGQGNKNNEGKKMDEKPLIKTIKLDEMIVINDFSEITLKGNVFGKVIDPPNPGDFYTHYENEEADQIFLDTIISVKSLLTSGKSAGDFASVKIIYDDKYEYTTFSTIEENGGSDFTYTNITNIEPLQTGVLHFLASVPSSVENDGKPLKAIITVNGETYEQIIR